MYCNSCGADNQPGSTFCIYCGSPLSNETSSPIPPVSSIPSVSPVPPVSTVPTPASSTPTFTSVPVEKKKNTAKVLSIVFACLFALSLAGNIVLSIVKGNEISSLKAENRKLNTTITELEAKADAAERMVSNIVNSSDAVTDILLDVMGDLKPTSTLTRDEITALKFGIEYGYNTFARYLQINYGIDCYTITDSGDTYSYYD